MELIIVIILLLLLTPKNKDQQNSNVDETLKFKMFNDIKNKKWPLTYELTELLNI